ncbi:hypothetical protein [Mycobacterium simiae]|uniref:hypothetical protein n=1 Tax=Mycobacterium simiae TaxID=1784 RepID=UPI00165F489D|nr:hypothetical protein [Mycobacterium simiae]
MRSTSATDGAVRPHPVSRVGVVATVLGSGVLNIVKEGTAYFGDDAGRWCPVEELDGQVERTVVASIVRSWRV